MLLHAGWLAGWLAGPDGWLINDSPDLIMEISKPTHELTGASDATGAELLSTRYACGMGRYECGCGQALQGASFRETRCPHAGSSSSYPPTPPVRQSISPRAGQKVTCLYLRHEFPPADDGTCFTALTPAPDQLRAASVTAGAAPRPRAIALWDPSPPPAAPRSPSLPHTHTYTPAPPGPALHHFAAMLHNKSSSNGHAPCGQLAAASMTSSSPPSPGP